ncbi:hypothetical protein LB099_06315 [Wolbachia endosymbiont of Nasonia oneida]
MKNFLLLVALILSFAFDANAKNTFVDKNDTTSSVIWCDLKVFGHIV